MFFDKKDAEILKRLVFLLLRRHESWCGNNKNTSLEFQRSSYQRTILVIYPLFLVRLSIFKDLVVHSMDKSDVKMGKLPALTSIPKFGKIFIGKQKNKYALCPLPVPTLCSIPCICMCEYWIQNFAESRDLGMLVNALQVPVFASDPSLLHITANLCFQIFYCWTFPSP